MSNLFISPNQIAVYFEKLNFYFMKTATISVYGIIAVYLKSCRICLKKQRAYFSDQAWLRVDVSLVKVRQTGQEGSAGYEYRLVYVVRI